MIAEKIVINMEVLEKGKLKIVPFKSHVVFTWNPKTDEYRVLSLELERNGQRFPAGTLIHTLNDTIIHKLKNMVNEELFDDAI